MGDSEQTQPQLTEIRHNLEQWLASKSESESESDEWCEIRLDEVRLLLDALKAVAPTPDHAEPEAQVQPTARSVGANEGLAAFWGAYEGPVDLVRSCDEFIALMKNGSREELVERARSMLAAAWTQEIAFMVRSKCAADAGFVELKRACEDFVDLARDGSREELAERVEAIRLDAQSQETRLAASSGGEKLQVFADRVEDCREPSDVVRACEGLLDLPDDTLEELVERAREIGFTVLAKDLRRSGLMEVCLERERFLHELRARGRGPDRFREEDELESIIELLYELPGAEETLGRGAVFDEHGHLPIPITRRVNMLEVFFQQVVLACGKANKRILLSSKGAQREVILDFAAMFGLETTDGGLTKQSRILGGYLNILAEAGCGRELVDAIEKDEKPKLPIEALRAAVAQVQHDLGISDWGNTRKQLTNARAALRKAGPQFSFVAHIPMPGGDQAES